MKLKDKALIRDVESRLSRLEYCIREIYYEELLTSDEHRLIYERLRKMQEREDEELYNKEVL